jgi:hypothetical protein
MSQTYQWLVQKGRIGMWLDGAHVHLEVDPEDSHACVLTRQDAEEVAQILYDMSYELWKASPPRDTPFSQIFKTTKPFFYEFDLPVNHLFIGIENSWMTIQAEPPGEILLSVDQTVQIIQILEHLLKGGS